MGPSVTNVWVLGLATTQSTVDRLYVPLKSSRFLRNCEWDRIFEVKMVQKEGGY